MTNTDKNFTYRLIEFLATWFYSGKSPFAPGTCGSLATLPFVFVISQFYGIAGVAVFAVVVSVAGIFIAGAFEKKLGIKDPGQIVIDETAGQAITLLAAGTNPYLYAIGFVLFRIFDISKPFPVGWADTKVKGGLGIMLDDILAGMMGGLILAMIKYYLF